MVQSNSGHYPTHNWMKPSPTDNSIMKPSGRVCANDRAGQFLNDEAFLSVMQQLAGGGPHTHQLSRPGGPFLLQPQPSSEGRILQGHVRFFFCGSEFSEIRLDECKEERGMME